MTKLKTLKDLESREKDLDFKDDFVIRESDLKQEAIRWVKVDIEKFGITSALYVNRKFMYFFNITEEDLK